MGPTTMDIRLGSAIAIVLAALIAACAGDASRMGTHLAPAPVAVAPDPPAAAIPRVTRYYVDETGAVWDDRGRRREPSVLAE